MVNAPNIKAFSLFSIVGFTCTSCCSNVITFESLIKLESNTSTFITFCQYVFVAISSYVLLVRKYGIRNSAKLLVVPTTMPLYRYLISTYGFCLASVLGNIVFRFHLSLPIHIIFRSSSTAFTMLLGYLIYRKKYSLGQMLGSVLMSLGVITVTISNMSDRSSQPNEEPQEFRTYFSGLAILVGVTMLTSFLSLYNESSNRIYRTKERSGSWLENLFYSHLYAIPFFLLMPGTLEREYKLVEGLSASSNFKKYWAFLLANVITQLLCVAGVNKIAILTSAVTLGVILLLKRFLSLLFSMFLFHNEMSPLGMLGTLMVFAGAGVYSYSIGAEKDKMKMKEKKE